jgi:hypothetical protein
MRTVLSAERERLAGWASGRKIHRPKRRKVKRSHVAFVDVWPIGNRLDPSLFVVPKSCASVGVPFHNCRVMEASIRDTHTEAAGSCE